MGQYPCSTWVLTHVLQCSDPCTTGVKTHILQGYWPRYYMGHDETGVYYMCQDPCSTWDELPVVHGSGRCSTGVYYMYMCKLHSSMVLPIMYGQNDNNTPPELALSVLWLFSFHLLSHPFTPTQSPSLRLLSFNAQVASKQTNLQFVTNPTSALSLPTYIHRCRFRATGNHQSKTLPS